MAEYTERVDGFQIRDVTYWGAPPKDAPIQYAVVKWVKSDPPYEAIDARTGEKKMVYEYCFVVADLVWDDREPCFDINSVGLRLLEDPLTPAAIEMVLDFCEKKYNELTEGRW